MGFRVTADEYERWVRLGLIPAEVQAGDEPTPRRRKAAMLPSVFVTPATWIIGIETVSEANHGGSRQAQMSRKANQRKAVMTAMAPYWLAFGPWGDAARVGKPVTLRIATLGCRERDRWDNLPRSLKAVLDAVCLMTGIDDGANNLTVNYDQHPEIPGVGVRVMLEVMT